MSQMIRQRLEALPPQDKTPIELVAQRGYLTEMVGVSLAKAEKVPVRRERLLARAEKYLVELEELCAPLV